MAPLVDEDAIPDLRHREVLEGFGLALFGDAAPALQVEVGMRVGPFLRVDQSLAHAAHHVHVLPEGQTAFHAQRRIATDADGEEKLVHRGHLRLAEGVLRSGIVKS